MFKQTSFLTALIVCLSITAKAQTDSAHYDLGRISVKKNFTQSITIKGSDLERFQFSDLADAINVWLYGTYSNSSSLIYVVDGNIINDVNAYSIYDIDEITLVQNALPMVSGADPSQQMVLIKLRSNRPGKQGIDVAGQTSAVNVRNQDNTPGAKTSTSLYNQYYLSGYKNYDNAHLGASVDYQRDVLPELTNSNFNSYDAFHFNRFKLNARADAKLWEGTTITLGVNYVPQVTNYGFNYNAPVSVVSNSNIHYYDSHVSQHLFNTNIALASHIADGLTNTLSGAYNHYNYFESDSAGSHFMSTGNPASNQNEFIYSFNKTSNLLIRDNLVYHTKLGVFDIEPSVNFSYRDFRITEKDSSFSISGSGGVNNAVSSQMYSLSDKYKSYLLSPSADIYYKDIFNIQGGFVSILNANKDFLPNYTKHRIFPFLTTSLDVSKLTGISDLSFRIFCSFARQNQLLSDDYATLSGFSLNGTSAIPNLSGYVSSGNILIPASAFNYYNPYQEYNNYQAGAVIGLFKNFTINYSFEYRYNLALAGVFIPYGINQAEFEEIFYNDKTVTNRVGFNYNYNQGTFNWRTGLNFAESKLQVVDNTQLAANFNSGYLSGGHRRSGGFTNRFTYKTLFAGLDVLYQLGQRPYSLMYELPGITGYIAPANTNSFSLQNLYVGTQLKITHTKYAELFANSRNILQNKTSDITDNRRFFGFGFKVGL